MDHTVEIQSQVNCDEWYIIYQGPEQECEMIMRALYRGRHSNYFINILNRFRMRGEKIIKTEVIKHLNANSYQDICENHLGVAKI